MKKRVLGVLAIVLIALMAIVAVAGLDGLPRELRTSANTAVAQVQNDRQRFDAARTAVLQSLNNQPALFRRQAAIWQDQLRQSDERLRQAESEAQKLRSLEKANRRDDRQTVAAAVSRVQSLRGDAVRTAENLRAETERWVGYQRDLPKQLNAMKSAYEAVHEFDVRSRATTAQKAMVDWPAKKDDIERRIQTLEGLKRQAEEAWTASAADREKAEAGAREGLDYSNLFAAGEAINEDLRELQRGTTTLNELAAQLYVGRDKLLLELDDEKDRKQKVRVVETKYADAALSNPQVNSREEWENVDANRFDQLKKSIGMVVERKPAGKYDSETDKVLQPPAYAYVAPPGQSNQYGSWNNGVWTWLPQYLLLSQMLRTTSYPPIASRDWYDYDRARRNGDVWYGRSGQYGGTWTRGGGSWTDRVRGWGSGTSSQGGGTISNGTTRPRDTWNTGGSTYGGSKYESRGGYGGSRYQSRPSTGRSGGSSFGGSRGSSRGTFGRSYGGRGGRR